MKRSWMTVLAVVFVLGLAGNAAALNFSFYGSFTSDDDVQIFSFTVGDLSSVTMRTWSYAGGVNAEGANVARGGFDPILALFDGQGDFIDDNDDGYGVAKDTVTNKGYDTLLKADLAAGVYYVAIMQYNNWANGPNLSDGFTRDGQGNFTGPWKLGVPGQFIDFVGNQRDGHWAFDILNVNEAHAVPIPAAAWLLGSGLFGLVGLRKKLFA